MIGDDIVSKFLDKTFEIVASCISWILENIVLVLFSNYLLGMVVFLILINIIAILLIKKDKEYAQSGARRVRESTLLLVALVGGGLGEYYAMYKYKHKTLHDKFLYGVPIAIMLNAAMLSYTAATVIFA